MMSIFGVLDLHDDDDECKKLIEYSGSRPVYLACLLLTTAFQPSGFHAASLGEGDCLDW
jgi:hypothetical protein